MTIIALVTMPDPSMGGSHLRPRVLRWLRAAARRPLLAVAVSVATVLAAVAVTFVLPARYRASTAVRAVWTIEADKALQRVTGDVAGRKLQALRGRALSPFVTQRILAEIEPYRKADGDEPPAAEQLARLLAAVSVERQGPDAFVIHYVHDDPGTAARVSNRLASLLVEEAEKEDAAQSQAHAELLAVRLNEARETLERRREALQSGHAGQSVESSTEASPSPEQATRLEVEKIAVASDLAAALARADAFRRALEDEDRRGTESSDPRAQELERLRARLADLRKRYTEKHPDVQALLRRIRRMELASLPGAGRSEQVSSLKAGLGDVEREIDDLKRRQARLQAESARLTRRARREGRSVEDLGRLTREFDEAHRAYRALEDEWRAAETAARTGGNAAPQIVVLQPASVPREPWFPNWIHFALVGVAFGLVLGLWVSVVAESRDRSVRGPEDLREMLPYPLLAQLPFVRTRRLGRRK
jgi:GumC protein